MSKLLKIYHLGSAWSCLKMLLDYLSTREDDQIIHIIFSSAHKLNEQFINKKNTVIFSKNEHSCHVLSDVICDFIANKKINHVNVHTEHRELDIGFGIVINGIINKVSLENLQCHLYDHDWSDVENRAKISSVNTVSLHYAIDSEIKRVECWLKTPSILSSLPSSSLMRNLLWHRVFNVKWHFLAYGFSSDNALLSEIYEGWVPMLVSPTKKVSLKNTLLVGKLLNLSDKSINDLCKLKNKKELIWYATGTQFLDVKSWIHNLADKIEKNPEISSVDNVIVSSKSESVFEIITSNKIIILPSWISPDYVALCCPDLLPAIEKNNKWLDNAENSNGTTLCRISQGQFLPTENDFLIDSESVHQDEWVFYMNASMGDVLYCLATLKSWKNTYKGKVIFVAHSLYREIISRCSEVDVFWPLDDIEEYQPLIKLAKKNGKYKYLMKFDWADPDLHFQKGITELLNVDFIPDEQFLRLTTTQEERKKVDDFLKENKLNEQRTVLLHTSIGSPNKTWSQENWSALADKFSQNGWRVILIGSNNNKHAHKIMPSWNDPRFVSAIDYFTPIEMITLMNACDLLVATDSGPIALAGASTIAICGIYSIVSARSRLPFRHGKLGWNAMGIDTNCHFGHCARWWDNKQFQATSGLDETHFRPITTFDYWCPNNKSYSCMKNIDADSFWKGITSFLESDAYIPKGMRVENI